VPRIGRRAPVPPEPEIAASEFFRGLLRCGPMLEPELECASELVRHAGRILLEIYATDFDVDFKSASDPVTEADRRADAFLVRGLCERFPDDGIVAEESAEHGAAERSKRCWFVDPLDGTKEFIAKNGEFSIMLGLAIDGEARLGAVYQPVGDKLYRGVVGQGAELVHAGQRSTLRVSQCAEPAALGLVVSRSHRPPLTNALVARLGIARESPSGSVGIKVGLIAEQRADLYVHLSGRSSKWDACAPDAILRAAGGRFGDLFGANIDYRERSTLNARGLLACNAAAWSAVLPVVSDVARQAGFK
jgi:3'(2'), 5'-bisphosphate nucleotidase